MPRHIRKAQVITQQHKLHESCNVPSDRFNVQFRLHHGSPTHGYKPAGDAHLFIYFSTCDLWTSSPQQLVWNFAIKSLDALGSLKHVSFDINHFYKFITPHSILNATQKTKAATKHVKITSFPLPIYSTLKFAYVIKYDRWPHSDTQTEWNEHEVTKCNQLQYVVYTTTSQGG
jgi:hypothetical protein